MSWPLPAEPADRLALAFGYPYAVPEESYLLRNGRAVALPANTNFAGRIAVLAHGSNRSPEQLARKFPNGEIPVTHGTLRDHTVVYAACLTRYGACPSLLHHLPGASARLSITWLTPQQLQFMHRTEGAYGFGRLHADFEVEAGVQPQELHLYHGRPGCLTIGADAVALHAITQDAGHLPTLSQRDALTHIHGIWGSGDSLESFVLAMIDATDERHRLRARLEGSAVSNPLPGFQGLVPEALD
ncbi:hypothetical protein [Aquibaculum sediminis]|uniref:hypothetical protein n=1 Tax=Aquibaculum sediminis TaxID=3231907 RepID=UPI003456D525